MSIVSIVVVATAVLVWARPAYFAGPNPEAAPPAAAAPGQDGSVKATEQPFALAGPADPNSLTVAGASFAGWALMDLASGRTVTSANAATESNTVESMIKPWLAADYLRQEADEGRQPTPDDLDELTLMIVDSNDPLAEKYYQLGGADAVIERLQAVCGLTDLYVEPTLWGMTRMTPLDAVRYGACVADGRAAGPNWTSWLLTTMRHVRGSVSGQDSGEIQGGRWGIIDGLPAELARDTSIKNGWTAYEDGWHVNCLAIHPQWVLSVMMRMPDELEIAAEGCASIAAGLVVEHRP